MSIFKRYFTKNGYAVAVFKIYCDIICQNFKFAEHWFRHLELKNLNEHTYNWLRGQGAYAGLEN